jgi:hypothetical protein
MSKETFSRKKLYELVWNESLLSLSKKYNISDVGLRKICKKMNIPTPSFGYWAKLHRGKTVHKAPLPQRCTGIQETSLSLRSDEDEKEVVESTFLSEQSRIKKEIEESIKIKIPKTFHTKNPLIQSTREHFSAEVRWKCPKPHLNINVSEKLENRALYFMTAFISAMEARGHQVAIKERKTIAVVSEEEFEFCIKEKSTAVPVKRGSGSFIWDSRDLIPNGKLYFQFGSCSYRKKEWVDAATIPIEDRIPSIIAYFEVKAAEEKRQRAEQEVLWRKQEEERLKAEERRERKNKEFEDFKALFTMSNRYQKATEIRAYIEVAKSQCLENDGNLEKLQGWIAWANEKADWVDPFINAEDEYLDEDDKDEIDSHHSPKTTHHSTYSHQTHKKSWHPSRQWWAR